jgi:hypothetical protein
VLLIQRAHYQSNSSQGFRRLALMCLGSLVQRNIVFRQEQIKVSIRLRHSFSSLFTLDAILIACLQLTHGSTLFVQAISEIALESKDERTVLRAMATLIKIFQPTGIMTSISLMDSEVKTIHSYIETALHILNHFLSTFSSAPSSSSLASGSRLEVLAILASYQKLSHDRFSEDTDQTYRERYTIHGVVSVKGWSQGSGQVEGREDQVGVSSTNDVQAKPALSSFALFDTGRRICSRYITQWTLFKVCRYRYSEFLCTVTLRRCFTSTRISCIID